MKKISKRELIKKVLIAGMVFGALAGILCTGLIAWLTVGRMAKTNERKWKEAQNTLELKEQEIKALSQAKEEENSSRPVSSSGEEWKLILVNETHPLDTAYAPQLVEVLPERLVDSRILDDTRQMLTDAENAGLDLYVVSSYRAYDTQRQVFNETMESWIAQGYSPLDAYDETKKSVAVPGTSEHATGLALDITSSQYIELDDYQAETQEAQWLAENCWKYGFILRYPPEKANITGIIYEPWHYRYVGKEAAKEITEQGVTLEEYLGEQ